MPVQTYWHLRSMCVSKRVSRQAGGRVGGRASERARERETEREREKVIHRPVDGVEYLPQDRTISILKICCCMIVMYINAHYSYSWVRHSHFREIYNNA